MADDEFKDVGRYFPEGSWLSLPLSAHQPDWTLQGWFIWMSGSGPLIGSENDDDWGWLYDRDGRCSYRIGGQERPTELSVESLQGHWIHVALAKAGAEATLWVDDRSVDTWRDAPESAGVSAAVVMKFAVGFAADIAYFKTRLPDSKLLAIWEVGKGRV
jgi:hypothetical protein